ncbi:MAG: MiaB/RimO family radical SAM methylthiotransferase [Anaerolineae bacterium]
MKVYVTSLGCRLNQSEMSDLAQRLANAGHTVVTSPSEADVVVANTCAVTAEAERKSRQLLRRLRRDAGAAFIAATGCLAELHPGLKDDDIPADIVLGNEGKRRLLGDPGSLLPLAPGIEDSPPATGGRTRALVRIQEGCDNHCSYCIVSRLRGPQRSRSESEVLAQVDDLVRGGYKEIVLTGVHIGAYGRDGATVGDTDLSRLVRRVLAETAVPRLRLSSVEPWDFRTIDLGLWADIRLCRHLHLPLQSGCDSVLQRMHRHYGSEEYAALLRRLRERLPGVAVTTDVIVAFPSETETEHAESLAFVERCGFARVHVFPYSARPGTEAATMPGQVGRPESAARARQMRDLAHRSRQRYEAAHVGSVQSVLWERRRNGRWCGLTSNYLEVWCQSDLELKNQFAETELVAFDNDELVGRLV